jgi:hypothetical protein
VAVIVVMSHVSNLINTKSKKSIMEQTTPSIPIYEERINDAKETVKERALDITDKMSKITDHLDIIKDMDVKEIYDKEKNLLIVLYDYYCKFQKVYFDLSFSQILNPVDITAIKKIDVKDFVNQIKALHKRDYEIAISSLKKEDTCSINESYMQLENAVDNLANTLINIQYSIIVQEISPIEQDVMLEKIKNRIEPSLAITDYRSIEENYLRYLDEFNASKETFK